MVVAGEIVAKDVPPWKLVFGFPAKIRNFLLFSGFKTTIIAGMIWYKHTGRDPSWIIIASAYAPDFDAFAGEMLTKLDMDILNAGTHIPLT